MNIVIGSAFRNATHYLSRYFRQVQALREHLDPMHTVRVIGIEGDSTDGTREVLKQYDLELVQHDHGKKWFGSTEEPERFVEISKIANLIFDHVKPTDDVLVFVESDLIWDAHTISSLVDMALRRNGEFDVFAPMIFAGENFYDVWGFRRDGERFSPFPPFHRLFQHGLMQVDSAGSCLVMRREVAQQCRIKNDYCLVGWCEDATAHGFTIAMDSRFRVHHP
jgi:hypothetical protein